MNQIARRHHTVPRFYLSGFANRADRLGVARLQGAKKFVQSINNVSVNNNFYTLESSDDPPDAFEKALGEIERAASKVFLKIVEGGGWPLNSSDRDTLAAFVALQHVRGPNERNRLSQMNWAINRLQVAAVGRKGLVRYFADERGVTISEDIADEIWQTFTGSADPVVPIASIVHFRQIVDATDQTLPYFALRPWKLVTFERKSLLTCDTPVSLIKDPESNPYEGVGLRNALSIAVPISRRIALFMNDPKQIIENGIDPVRVQNGEFDENLGPSAAVARILNSHAALNELLSGLVAESSPADECCGEVEESVVDVGAAFPAHGQAPELVQ